jgi:peptidyl-prolyl cis-trans isomerase C
MRKILFAIIFIILFVVACSSRESEVRSLEGVRIYTAIHNGEVAYSERVFKGDDAKLFADVVKAECPQGAGDEFVRTEIDATSSKLVIYTDKSGKNVTCSILKPGEQKQIIIKPAAEAPQGVAVTVNSKDIPLDAVRTAVAQLPESQRTDNNINIVVNQLINDELLRQEAEKLEISEEEIATARAELLAQAGITEAELPARLQANGASLEQFGQDVILRARLHKLFNERLLMDEITVGDDEALAFYANNPNQFLQTEQAVMRQIFIKAEGRTREQAAARAQAAAAALQKSDFCEVVRTYSDDEQSKDGCGVYIIPRGVIDPNLELAAFGTPANQTSVVTTETGIHLVQTLQVAPAQVVPYAQVAANLQSSLKNTLLQQRLNLYISELRAEADIVSYLG